MKYVMILPDGAADEPCARLGGRTPLDVARKPQIDELARMGIVGRAVTVPTGFSPGSDVATLSLFGYDPRTCYSGRAPLEAAARGIAARPEETIFRCNFVTIADGLMRDFTAGHISQPEADRLIDELNRAVGGGAIRFYPGVSYRNLLVAACPGDGPLLCTPPHDIPDQPVDRFMPRGPGDGFVRGLMDKARRVLADHDINRVRCDLGENPATDIWLWGQGRAKALEPFARTHGVSCAVIAAVDLIRGIACSAGAEVLDVPGATGYLDTDYDAKARAAIEALGSHDLVVIHIEAPDEAGHLGDPREKVLALERIDQHVVGPVLDRMRSLGAWRILIAPDHPTPVDKRVHTADPPPFCLVGDGVEPDAATTFSEAAAATGLLVDPGHELIRRLLAR